MKPTGEAQHFVVLDGWRGLSILFVLAAHLLPIGPKSWHLNSMVGPLGMVIFFILSGFLITNFLLERSNLVDFLIRRFFRILPLAWLYMGIALAGSHATANSYWAHFLFYANWPPMQVGGITSHLWSLCVEVQFYVGIALLITLLGRRGLLLIPIICIAVTWYRYVNGVHIAINTYFRIDEILAGSALALIFNNRLGSWIREFLKFLNQWFLLILLLVSCHPDGGFMNYLRPYIAAMLVGATLFNKQSQISTVLRNRVLHYFAMTSYALYIIHPLLADIWLGSGVGMEKYIKRPLLFATIIIMAHASTFYYEHKWIALGKRISARLCLYFR